MLRKGGKVRIFIDKQTVDDNMTCTTFVDKVNGKMQQQKNGKLTKPDINFYCNLYEQWRRQKRKK